MRSVDQSNLISFPLDINDEGEAFVGGEYCNAPYVVEQLSGFDAIVIDGRVDPASIAAFRRHNQRHLLPVIDRQGYYRHWADAVVKPGDRHSWTASIEIARAFAERRNALTPQLRATEDSELRLLTHLYVSNRALAPMYQPWEKVSIGYNPFIPVRKLRETAEKLVGLGHLQRLFFDRIHSCENCGSTRLNVREECLNCRSANISELPLIHHYPCGYQGPEDDFTRGDQLVCPKCLKKLTHYGSDYERSGHTLNCGDCGAANSRPDVGFLCLDCSNHQRAESIKSEDFFSYELSNSGIAHLAYDRQSRENRLTRLQSLGMPLEIRCQIQKFFVEKLSNGAENNSIDFVIAEYHFVNSSEIISRIQHEGFAKIRRHVLENLRNLLSSLGTAASGNDYDYLFLKGVSKANFEEHQSFFVEKASNHLKEKAILAFNLYDSSDLLCVE